MNSAGGDATCARAFEASHTHGVRTRRALRTRSRTPPSRRRRPRRRPRRRWTARPSRTRRGPAGWTRSDATYVRLTNAAGRNHGTYAAEMWAQQHHTAHRQLLPRLRPDGLHERRLWTSGTTSRRSAPLPTTLVSSTPRTAGPVGRSSRTGPARRRRAGWQARNYALPVGGTVRVRFSGSVNATTEYADWDDIAVTRLHDHRRALRSSTSTTTATGRRDVVLQPSHRRQRRELVGPDRDGSVPHRHHRPGHHRQRPRGLEQEPGRGHPHPHRRGRDRVHPVRPQRGRMVHLYAGPFTVSTEGTSTLQVPLGRRRRARRGDQDGLGARRHRRRPRCRPRLVPSAISTRFDRDHRGTLRPMASRGSRTTRSTGTARASARRPTRSTRTTGWSPVTRTRLRGQLPSTSPATSRHEARARARRYRSARCGSR